jgi:hypothetical protein
MNPRANVPQKGSSDRAPCDNFSQHDYKTCFADARRVQYSEAVESDQESFSRTLALDTRYYFLLDPLYFRVKGSKFQQVVNEITCFKPPPFLRDLNGERGKRFVVGAVNS